jgi:NADH-quinone oxidoreductase subunit E
MTDSLGTSPSTNTGPNYGTEPFEGNGAREDLPTAAAAGRSNFRTSVIHLDRPGDPSVFGEQVRRDAAELIARYPEGQSRSALLPLLHLVQSEQGYVSPDGIAFCADVLDITKAQVAAVATFYTMYKRQPTGEYLVSVCTNTLCGVLGGDEIFAALKDELGVGNNQTTPDGKITLEHAECLAACDYAPVVTVNYEFFDNQSVDSARGLVGQLREGERPLPTRGAPLCSFKQIERQIAGFFDEAALAPDAPSSGAPTEAGVKLAIERGDTAPSYSLESSAAPSSAPETAPETPKEPAKKRGVLRSRARSATAKSNRADQPTSQHDAPLSTSGSDAANEAKPAGEEAK